MRPGSSSFATSIVVACPHLCSSPPTVPADSFRPSIRCGPRACAVAAGCTDAELRQQGSQVPMARDQTVSADDPRRPGSGGRKEGARGCKEGARVSKCNHFVHFPLKVRKTELLEGADDPTPSDAHTATEPPERFARVSTPTSIGVRGLIQEQTRKAATGRSSLKTIPDQKRPEIRAFVTQRPGVRGVQNLRLSGRRPAVLSFSFVAEIKSRGQFPD